MFGLENFEIKWRVWSTACRTYEPWATAENSNSVHLHTHFHYYTLYILFSSVFASDALFGIN